MIHNLFLRRLLYKPTRNVVQLQLLKFTIILLFYDAGVELKLEMLLVFMFKEQSHNFSTLSCFLKMTLNLASVLIFFKSFWLST